MGVSRRFTMAFTAKDEYLMALYKAQYDAELQEAREWISGGRVWDADEYPFYMELSCDVLDEFFKKEMSGDAAITHEMLILEIGRETHAIHADFENEAYESRCNYACTLYELYRERIVEEPF